MNWDLIITALIIAVALFYLIYKGVRFVTGKESGCSCTHASSNCGSCTSCSDIYEKMSNYSGTHY
jgi:hypothetical protein